MIKENDSILILAPHADDEVIGMGGTISKYADLGCKVNIAVLTNASLGAPELYHQDEIRLIREEALMAHQILGVTKTHFFDLPAPALDQYPIYKIASLIKSIIEEVNPAVMFVPHAGDAHIDHQVIHDASLVASRPHPDSTIRSLFAYETLSETHWGRSNRSFIPNYFEEISLDNLESKINALKCFASQIKLSPHARSIEAIRSLAIFRGHCNGLAASEGFKVIRIIK